MNATPKNIARTNASALAQTYRFTRRDLAFSFAAREGKAMWVMLGDDDRFWVATPATCACLEKMGYEYAL